MNRKEFLSRVKEEAGLDTLAQADQAVRVVVGILKTLLPQDLAAKVAEKLPQDLRAGWEIVAPYPADILEREDIYYFEGVDTEESKPDPTITEG
jgi:uncharacterized protein (DUF2267 family)